MTRASFTFAFAFAFAGCADTRDFFHPYVPMPEEIREVLRHPDPARPADVAIAFGCPANPDGTLSECEACRVDAAVRLYRAGHFRQVIFTGGDAHSQYVEADVMADAAIARGMPAEAVLREGRAMTTWQNFRFSLKIMRAKKLRSVLMLSTADHLPRVRRMAHFYGLRDEDMGFRACDEAPTEAPSAPPAAISMSH